MTDSTTRLFGLLIAYVLPGFFALVGFVPLIPTVGQWLQPVSLGEFGLGPPIYSLMTATVLGMLLSCLRWAIIDVIHHRTGITPPRWDPERLEARMSAFTYLVENHYRYYQFYASVLVAAVLLYPLNRASATLPYLGPGTDLGAILLCAILFAGSRDALAKYYQRTSRLVGSAAEKGLMGEDMTNGCHHDTGGGTAPKGETAASTKPKPQPEVKQAINSRKGTKRT